jgi:hypothetical protein
MNKILFAILILFSPLLSAQTVGSMSLNGIPGQQITNAVGFAPTFAFSGTVVTAPKCAAGTTTSTTSGTWTVSYSGVGFTTISSVQVQATSTAQTAAGQQNATISSVSTTAASGAVLVPTVAVLGNLGIALSTTAVTVYVMVCGS